MAHTPSLLLEVKQFPEWPKELIPWLHWTVFSNQLSKKKFGGNSLKHFKILNSKYILLSTLTELLTHVFISELVNYKLDHFATFFLLKVKSPSPSLWNHTLKILEWMKRTEFLALHYIWNDSMHILTFFLIFCIEWA